MDAPRKPNRIFDYFRREWLVLLLVTISGLVYNVGLLAGPWFEGQMTGCLVATLEGKKKAADMLVLVAGYILAIAIVQISRYAKRFYVRRFANNVNRSMKQTLYANLVRKSRKQLQEEGAGNIMTKAILDVDDCVEGMRKFTTEIFDTGVALAAYAGMLLYYDWRLALLCMVFPPISYLLAEKMKVVIQQNGTAYKEQAGALSAATLDCASNAITYRVFGCETKRQQAYEERLAAYETSAVKASIWNTVLPPAYRVIAMAGVLFIFYFGGRNVMGVGWKTFDVAAFTTFLSCFTKLSAKSSGAAKLFNSVHKAQVSWRRIQPLLGVPEKTLPDGRMPAGNLSVSHLHFSYPGEKTMIEDLPFQAKPGEYIGITGPVACGKSTLGKVFLCEEPYGGSIQFMGQELKQMSDGERRNIIGYLGHDPELMNDTIEQNIQMGEQRQVKEYLEMVCLEEEVQQMEQGMQTVVGSSGVRLSGGQAKRLSLARTLYHHRPVWILDDPFSALDRETEREVFANMKQITSDSIVLLISHRLYLFPQMQQIIWMEKGKTIVGTHRELMEKVPEYRQLFEDQEGGASDETD